MKKNELSPMPNNIKRFGKTRILLTVLGLLFLLLIVFLLADVSRQQQVVKKENPRIRLGKAKQERWYSEERFNLGNYLFKSREKDDDSPPLDSIIKEDNNKTQPLENLDTSKEFLDAVKAPGEVTVVKAADHSTRLEATIPENSSSPLSLTHREIALGDLGEQSSQLQTGMSSQDKKERYLRSNVLPGEYLSYAKERPLAKYEIKAGTYIPAILEQGINSDLPGNLKARVRANVYDTVTGNHILIPQGASLIGTYDSTLGFGQNRVLVVWQRLIYPDGSSLNLEKMQGVDVSGYAGFKDKVRHHRLQIYGNALLLSLVGAGYDLLVRDTGADNAEDVVARSVGQQLADVFSQVTKRNLERQPTIEIRPGYRFNVLLLKDIILESTGL